MKDLYEEYLNWLAKELNNTSKFEEKFLEIVDCTDDEYYEFLKQVCEHDLVVITKLCWERCKEGAKYEY